MSTQHSWEGTQEQIAAVLLPFGINPSRVQVAKIRDYIHLLLKWNKLTSLTSVTDPEEIVARHFGESVFLSTILPVENGRLADVGSGAGFPGLALKIVRPDVHMLLIESNKKKAAFLSEVVRALDIAGVDVLSVRFEDVRPDGTLNFVTARAVGGFRDILRWGREALGSRGHIALWLGETDTTRISQDHSWTWSPAVRIPQSQRRFILIGRPVGQK